MQIVSLSVCAVGLLTSTTNAARITQNTNHIRSELPEVNKTPIYSRPVLPASNLSHTSQNWLATPAPSKPTIREPLPVKVNATHIGNQYRKGQLTGYNAFLSHPSKNASVPTQLYTEDKTFNRGVSRGFHAGMNHRASTNSSDLSASGSKQYMNGQLAGYRAALDKKVNNHARVSKQEFPTSILQHDVVFNAGARAGFEAGANSHFSRVHSGHLSHQQLSRQKSDASSQKLVSHSQRHHEKGTGSFVKEASRAEASSPSGHDEHSFVKQADHHHASGEKHHVKAAGAHIEHTSVSTTQTQRVVTDHTKSVKETHTHEGHRVSHSSAASRTPEETKKTKDEDTAQFFAGREVGITASTRFPNSQISAYFKKDQSFNSGVQAGFEANVHSHPPQ